MTTALWTLSTTENHRSRRATVAQLKITTDSDHAAQPTPDLSASEVGCTGDLRIRGCVHRTMNLRRVRTRMHGRRQCPNSPAQMSGICSDVGLCSGAFNGAVDGGATDGEQLGQVVDGVFAALVKLDEVGFLFVGELRLFAA